MFNCKPISRSYLVISLFAMVPMSTGRISAMQQEDMFLWDRMSICSACRNTVRVEIHLRCISTRDPKIQRDKFCTLYIIQCKKFVYSCRYRGDVDINCVSNIQRPNPTNILNFFKAYILDNSLYLSSRFPKT